MRLRGEEAPCYGRCADAQCAARNSLRGNGRFAGRAEAPERMSRGCVIFNGGAGHGSEERRSVIVDALHQARLEFDFMPVMDRPVGELAEEALARRPDWIAAAGGDGTVEKVAACLSGTKVALGVIPIGTYNNFARSLGLPEDLLEAARVIAKGERRMISAGEVNGQPFFECAGVGLDAALFPYGEEIKSGIFSRVSDALRRAFTYPRREFLLELDRPVRDAVARAARAASTRWPAHLRRSESRELRVRAHMITISNAPFYGMNFTVAPEQRMDDGMLTVTVFHNYSKRQLLVHFLSISFGRRPYVPRAGVLRVEGLKVDGARPMETHLDGSPLRVWPLAVRCRPRALDVFAPEKS